MEIAIISDTHIPSRAQAIPEQFRDRIGSADHVIHAGDFDSEGALADQRALARELTAVAGNMDPDVGLPMVATIELGGVEFIVTHGTGSPSGWERRVAETAREHAETDSPIVVAGHTHEVTDTHRNGVRLLNPGSTTSADPATRATMMTAIAEDGEIDVTVHEA